MSNIQVLANAEVLGAPVDAAYQKTDDGSLMLVYGNPTTENWITLQELLTQLGSLVTLGSINQDTIKNALPEAVQSALEKISFCIKTVYFLKKTSAPGGAGGDADKPSEFAFAIDMKLDSTLMAAFPIKVTNVSFKIWATANQQVLDDMQINKIQNLLKASGG